jgi:tetratricopeptide (TPR) repeat protein
MTGLLLIGWLWAAPVAAAEPADAPVEEVDLVAVAAVLVRDGHLDRAAGVLAEVDPTAEGVDLVRYHLLRGLLALDAQRPEDAIAAFEASIAAGNQDPAVRVPLARALVAAGRPGEAVAAVSGAELDGLPSAWRVRAEAYKASGDPDRAYGALNDGVARFPDDADLALARVLLLIELGLFLEARSVGRSLLDRPGAPVTTWLAVSEATRVAGDPDGAILLLEEARLRFPAEVSVHKQLAGTWLQLEHPLAAAQVLAVAVELDPSLATQAAECYRRAGWTSHALVMNGRVADPIEKSRQRLGLLVDEGRIAEAVALVPRLSRLGLLADDSVSYAIGYAWFGLGEYDAAEQALSDIEDPAVFRSAVSLRQAIGACRAEPGACGS